MKKTILLILIFILTSSLSFYLGYKFPHENETNTSETAEYKHEIEIKEKNCLDKAISTADSINCVIEADDAWEKEIQHNLKKLKRAMTESDFKDVDEMNKKWQESYKSQINVIDKFIYNKQGTMYQQIGTVEMAELTENYAKFLNFLYDIYLEY